MKDKIKIAMIKAGKTNKEIAESIGKSQANFSQSKGGTAWIFKNGIAPNLIKSTAI